MYLFLLEVLGIGDNEDSYETVGIFTAMDKAVDKTQSIVGPDAVLVNTEHWNSIDRETIIGGIVHTYVDSNDDDFKTVIKITEFVADS